MKENEENRGSSASDVGMLIALFVVIIGIGFMIADAFVGLGVLLIGLFIIHHSIWAKRIDRLTNKNKTNEKIDT